MNERPLRGALRQKALRICPNKCVFVCSVRQTVYTAAVEKCSVHPRVVDFLGDAIKGFGEESRRGRRTHIR